MLKRNKILIMMIFIISTLPISNINAQVFEQGDLKYKEINGSIKIVEYTGEEGSNVIIPNKINGEKVIEIGEEAFEESHIKSVELPNTIKIIGKKAFTKNNLENILLPDSVTKIGERAFHRNNIVKVTISERVTTIGEHAFYMNHPIKITIIGNDDSEAQRYANSKKEKEKGTKFECLDCKNDMSVSLKINKKDLSFTASLYKEDIFKFDNPKLNYEIKFGEGLKNTFTVQYTVGEFIHKDSGITLEPNNKSEFYKTRTGKTYDASKSKVFSDTIELNFLEFDNRNFIEKGNYKSEITTEVLAGPIP